MTAPARTRRNVNADIDESLFGQTRASQTISSKATSKSSTKPSKSSASVVSNDMLSKLGIATIAQPHNHSVDQSILRPADLVEIERIANNRSFVRAASPVQQAGANAINQSSNPHPRSTKHRPAHNPHYQSNQHHNDQLLEHSMNQMSEQDLEDAKAREAILHNAAKMLDENHDEVKHMNQLVLYAKCVAIRDAQLTQKQSEAAERAAKDAEINAQIESDRQRKMAAEQAHQSAKEAERRAGAATIIEQIHAREIERMKADEARELQAKQMREAIAKNAAIEEAKRIEKIEKGKQLMAEISVANAAATTQKLRKKEAEAEEERARVAYLAAKEARERAAEEEANRIRAEKEREIARLRAQQEKAQDRQSALDEIRAKRYQQEKDRQHRQAVLQKEQERLQSMKQIESIRAAQIAGREEKQQMEKIQSKAELEHIQAIQQAELRAQMKILEEKEAERKKHSSELYQQIQVNHDSKKKARDAYLSESSEIAARNQAEKQKLEQIRQAKIAELESMGVHEKYLIELKQLKICDDKITKTNIFVNGNTVAVRKDK